MRKLMARALFTVLVTVLGIAWAMDSSTCGQPALINTPHLTHSNPTGHWPWHVAIFHRHTDSEPTYECGGTLISCNFILTAAHCVYRNGTAMGTNEIAIALGRLNLAADETSTEQSFNVTKIVVHKNYGSTNYENDIAVVRLSHTVTFNNFVRPICLWKPNETDLSQVTNKLGTVVGWGLTETEELANVLQEAHFIVVSHGRCLASNRDFYGYYLTEKNFCAGLRNGTSVCKGDSGGSITFEVDGRYYIRGIVSSAPSKKNFATHQWSCDTMQYAIYTDVAKYLQWIGQAIGTECQTEVRCVEKTNEWGECAVDTPQKNNSNPTRYWPWHAAIFHRHTDSEPAYQCGGSLISRNFILTAAHCVSRSELPMEPNKIAIALGRLNLAADETSTEQSFNVTKIVLHKNYGSTNFENDIAVVRLSHSATFNMFVRPVCLWNPYETDLSQVINKIGTRVGWGLTETYKISNILQESHYKVVSHGRCLASNQDFYGSYLTETIFCAGFQNGEDFCTGSNGGSLTFEEDGTYYMRGIYLSHSLTRNRTTQRYDCSWKDYGIFTDVAMYLQWIDDTIEIECQTLDSTDLQPDHSFIVVFPDVGNT